MTKQPNFRLTPTLEELRDAGVKVPPGSASGDDVLERYLKVPNHALLLYTSEDAVLDRYIREHWAALGRLTGEACDLHVSLLQLVGEADAYSQFEEIRSVPGLKDLTARDLPALHIWSEKASSTISFKDVNKENEVRDRFREIFSVVQEANGPIVQSDVKKLSALNKLNETNTTKDTHVKLLCLVVLMIIAFGGFYFLTPEKAIMWLLFVIIAIPPILAVVFESSKLSSANIVDLYRLGLQGLPIIGRLFTK